MTAERGKINKDQDLQLASALKLTNSDNWIKVRNGIGILGKFPEEEQALKMLTTLAADVEELDCLRTAAIKSLYNFDQPELIDFYEKIVNNPHENKSFIQQAENNLNNLSKRIKK